MPDPKHSPRRLSVAASFLTDAALLERHLPEGFALAGEPVVTVEFHYMTGIDWLAGRGYTMIDVGWPATFAGRQDKATGRFLAVVWENLSDPIITGRGEIGHPKLYAEIAEPRLWDGAQICAAGWMGFRFLDVTVSELHDRPSSPTTPRSDGTLMLKYVPRTGTWGEADLQQVSWYNRAGVEHVMGFCTEEEYREFLRACPLFEEMLIGSGITLIKYWFSVSDEEQEKRFQERMRNPIKRWKLSPMDVESRRHWVDYSKAKDVMFAHTDTKKAPWHVVNADDKKRARLNCIAHLLQQVPYQNMIPVEVELPPPQSNEGYKRPKMSRQRFVPDIY